MFLEKVHHSWLNGKRLYYSSRTWWTSALWNLLEICNTGCLEKLFMEKCLSRSALLQKSPRGRPAEVAGWWVLLATILRFPASVGAGYWAADHATGAWSWAREAGCVAETGRCARCKCYGARCWGKSLPLCLLGRSWVLDKPPALWESVEPARWNRQRKLSSCSVSLAPSTDYLTFGQLAK